MPDHAASPPPSEDVNGSKADESVPQSTSGARSILGMALVSALNIGCVAFVAYHYTTHADEPVPSVDIQLRPGNVDLESGPTNLLAVATHVEPGQSVGEASAADMPSAAWPPAPDMTTLPTPGEFALKPEAMVAKAEEHKTPEHWVQLGALSKIATARSYWSKLQKHHDNLLGNHQPIFVGPDQAGGSLYHIRVGPLAAHRAANLCSDLQQAGTDCFCVSADDGEKDHQLSAERTKNWPAPS